MIKTESTKTKPNKLPFLQVQEIGYHNCRKELFRMRRSTGHTISLPEEVVIIQKCIQTKSSIIFFGN